jgi:hypothetical protein
VFAKPNDGTRTERCGLLVDQGALESTTSLGRAVEFASLSLDDARSPHDRPLLRCRGEQHFFQETTMNDDRLLELLKPVIDDFTAALVEVVRNLFAQAIERASDGMRVAIGEGEAAPASKKPKRKMGPVTCKRCGVVGHNRRGCSEPPAAWETEAETELAEPEPEPEQDDEEPAESAESTEETVETEEVPAPARTTTRRNRFAEIEAAARKRALTP